MTSCSLPSPVHVLTAHASCDTELLTDNALSSGVLDLSSWQVVACHHQAMSFDVHASYDTELLAAGLLHPESSSWQAASLAEKHTRLAMKPQSKTSECTPIALVIATLLRR